MNIKDFAQPTILSGKQYGTTITIELDHSDTSIDEVMDGFLTIAKGLGYLDSTINEWIKDKAKDVYDDEHTIVKNAFAEDWFDRLKTTDWDEERIDIIGQNGNEGTHYGLATDEDMEECELNEKQLKDYKGVYVEKPQFDWDDEDLDWPQPNDKLKEAAQKYSEEFDENEFDDYGKRIEKNGK